MSRVQTNPAGEAIKDSPFSSSVLKFLSPLPRFSWPLVPHCLCRLFSNGPSAISTLTPLTCRPLIFAGSPGTVPKSWTMVCRLECLGPRVCTRQAKTSLLRQMETNGRLIRVKLLIGRTIRLNGAPTPSAATLGTARSIQSKARHRQLRGKRKYR
jgi:hypothetical protein